MSNEKKPRGFAALTKEKLAEISRKGGRAAHQAGTAHEWTSEEAGQVGKKGGKAVRRRERDPYVAAQCRENLLGLSVPRVEARQEGSERVMANIVETRKYPQQNGVLIATITDDGNVVFAVAGHAGLSPTVLRELADLADAAVVAAKAALRAKPESGGA